MVIKEELKFQGPLILYLIFIFNGYKKKQVYSRKKIKTKKIMERGDTSTPTKEKKKGKMERAETRTYEKWERNETGPGERKKKEIFFIKEKSSIQNPK